MKLHNTLHFAVAILLCGLLTACAGAPLAPAKSAPSQIMAVPNDEGMLARRLRQSLHERGWALIQYDAGALTRNHGYRGLARQAKYRLTFSGKRIGNCRGGTPSFLYNLAVIENATGNVEIALTGASCLDTTLTRFEAGLDRNKLMIPTVGAGD